MGRLTTTWAQAALESVKVATVAERADSPALRRRLEVTAADSSVASYDCCSPTVTKGPGCCEIRPEDAGMTALWPVAMASEAA
jgi:hypothetical protein